MNNMKLVPVLVVVGLVLIALSGCTGSSNYQAPITPPAAGGDDTHVATAPTSDSMASELSSGTGSGSDDVTDDDMDSLQNDMDQMEVDDDQSEESNI